MQDFTKLAVWQKAHALAIAIYKITESFPKEEVYGLSAQIRLSAVSVPSNIAEGCGREGKAELNRFLQISLGSSNEIEYQLLLAKDLHFINLTDFQKLNSQVIEVRKMLLSLTSKV